MMVLPIETPRLTLRDYREEDWVQVHAYARDLEVTRFMDWGPNSEADTRSFISQAMASEQQQPRKLFELAVIFNHTGALIGGVTLKLGESDPHSAELGYTFHRLAWGQGLGTEAARALIEFGFGFLHLKARRVWAKCRPENIGSYRVMKKVGMRFEEYLQNDRTARGQLVDSFLCGLTRQEWQRR